MMPNQVEIPNGGFVKMNFLLWNYRGALNNNFKRRVLEMMVNHFPAIMVITETRVGGETEQRRSLKIFLLMGFLSLIQ